ncbi:unnamed protein product, partial [Musa textilis]
SLLPLSNPLKGKDQIPLLQPFTSGSHSYKISQGEEGGEHLARTRLFKTFQKLKTKILTLKRILFFS